MFSTATLQHYGFFIKIGLSVFLGLAASLAEHYLNKHYLPIAERKNQTWRKILLTSVHGPFSTWVWSMIITLILQSICSRYGIDNRFILLISPLRRVLTLIFLLWFGMRLIHQWEQVFLGTVENGSLKAFQDTTSVQAIAQVLRTISIVVILLMVMSTVGINTSALLTAGGIGGLAISFAAKDTLANFIGGLMIYWDRPFSVGDWVRSPDREIEGTVTNIGWRLTTIRTFDKRPLYIPNGVFSNISLENPTRMLNRRIKTTIGLRYDDASKVEKITGDITRMLQQHPEIDTTQTLFVKLIDFGSSSLNILVYAFTQTTEWIKFQSVQEDVLLKIIDIIDQNSAQFAFPTTTLHIRKDGAKQLESDNE